MNSNGLFRQLIIGTIFILLCYPISVLPHEFGHYLGGLYYGTFGTISINWFDFSGSYQPVLDVGWLCYFLGGFLVALVFALLIFSTNSLFVRLSCILFVVYNICVAISEGFFLNWYENPYFCIVTTIIASVSTLVFYFVVLDKSSKQMEVVFE